MMTCQEFFEILNNKGFCFFTGIPDSTFKDWMKFLADNDKKILTNLIACNECEAIALSAGYHLATGKIGVVYMQNSGLGKTVNPLTSLCDPDVFSIPVLLMIGWRGQPGIPDEPQHKKMGRIMLSLLNTLEIPYSILENDRNKIKNEIDKASNFFNKNKGPYALIIKPDLFANYEFKSQQSNEYELTREDSINILLDNLNKEIIIVSTTGYISRELYEYRDSKSGRDHYRSFYNVGSMGCASSIGLSVALQRPDKKVLVFDGDGAIIMQMGSLTTIGKYAPTNFIHIIFDNNAHESTGGQPTNSDCVDLLQVALASNYKFGRVIKKKEELIQVIPEIKNKKGPIIIIIKIKMGVKKTLKRPEKSPKEYKEDFMKFLSESK